MPTNESTLPAGWRVIPVSQTAKTMKSGGTPRRQNPEFWNGEIPFVLIEDMTASGLYLTRTEEYISQAGLDASSAWIVPPGSVLLSMYATIGATVVTKISVATNQAILAIIPQDDICPEFLAFCLRAHKEDLSARNVQATQKNINKGIVESFPLPVPQFLEQQKIARILGDVQRSIAIQQELIKLNLELKTALLNRLFTQGVTGEPSASTEIGPIPHTWKLKKLQEVCGFQSGGTPSKQRPDYWQGAIPWVSPKDMKRPRLNDVVDHISEEGLEAGSALAPAGSIFVVIRGMILAKDVPVALAQVAMAFNQDIKAIVPGDEILPEFLLYALTALKPRLFQKVGRSAHGTMTLVSNDLAEFQIPMPDKNTQAEVCNILRHIDERQDLYARKLSVLYELFESLLQKFMRGQLSVHDLGSVDLPDTTKLDEGDRVKSTDHAKELTNAKAGRA